MGFGLTEATPDRHRSSGRRNRIRAWGPVGGLPNVGEVLSSMIVATRIALLLAIALLSASSCADRAGPTQVAVVIAILDVNVVPMDVERVLRNQTVIIRNGLIEVVDESGSVKVPERAQRIDGSGRYLLPGLADCHVHLRDTTELLSYLTYGVTTVVHLSGPTGNVPDVLDLRRRLSNGEILGPTIYTTGRILDGDPPINPGVSTRVRTPEDASTAVASQVEAGVDFIKVYNNLSEEPLRAAINTAHERGVAVFGHIPRVGGRAQALQAALSAGLDVIAHGEEYFFTFFYDDVETQLDKERVPTLAEHRIPEAVRLTREAGAAVTPNLSFVAMTRAQLDDVALVVGDREARFLHPDVLDMWRRQNPTTRRDIGRFELRERAKYGFLQRLTLALSEADVPLLLGTDASAPGLFPGMSAHLELRELVKAGLTPYEAIAAGTRSPGAFIGNRVPGVAFGSITPGSRADLLLLRGNPLDDVVNAGAIEGVLVRGAWFTRRSLEERRERSAVSNDR